MNNYKKGFFEQYNYYNFSDRADYNINDKVKVFGRVSRYYTDDLAGNPTPQANTRLYVPTGSQRGAWQIAGDVTWTINPRTVAEVHGDWHNVIDAYVSTPLGSGGWSSIWTEQRLVQILHVGQHGRAVVLPPSECGRRGLRRRRFLLGPAA